MRNRIKDFIEKINIKTIVLTSSLLGIATPVYAVNKIEGGNITIESLGNIIKNLATKIQVFGIILAFIALVIFVIQFIIGDDETKQRKKKTIIYTLVGVALLILFLILALKVNFGTNLGLVILLAMIGNLAGTSLGVLIASCFKVSEGTKTGITISVSMILSVLSGMMGVTLKYLIDKNAPIINRMNPNNLITDGFYSLYYYNTLDRYWSDILNLLIFSIICLVISFISLRREKYDNI